MAGEPCWEGCTCKKHSAIRAKCLPNCECGKHVSGPDHRNWKETPSSGSLHGRVGRRYGKANQYSCIDCGGQALDWSQTHGTDGKSVDDYEPRCRSCHIVYDKDARWGNEEYRRIQSEKQRIKALAQWAKARAEGRWSL